MSDILATLLRTICAELRSCFRALFPPTVPSLLNITLTEANDALSRDIITSQILVKVYLQRIKEVDHVFRSVLETNPDALSIAQTLDEERRKSGPRGPLHGIPILLKDSIVTLDGMNATCGSYALVGAKPSRESAVVTALRRAGAVLLGKTNMAEWSGFRSTSGCSGWSARGGQVTGPYYEGSKTSGSSSGSAAATSLGLAFAAIGTETCFSIVSPAEWCGVVGYKPTRELISTDGIIYSSKNQDTVGVLTRTVRDAAIIVDEITRQAEALPHSPVRRTPKLNLRSSCSAIELAGIRIGVPDQLHELQNVSPAKRDAFASSLSLLAEAGAEIVRDVAILGASEYESGSQEARSIVLDTDMNLALNSYFSTLTSNPQSIHSLRDLISFTKKHPKEEYPRRNAAVLERAERTCPLAPLYREMRIKEDYFVHEGGVADALDRHNLHVLLVPKLSVTLQTLAAKGGSPALSVPMGCYPEGTEIERNAKNGLVTAAPGIPFSLYIYGRANEDEAVLRVGYAFERLSRVREGLKPYILPFTDITDEV